MRPWKDDKTTKTTQELITTVTMGLSIVHAVGATTLVSSVRFNVTGFLVDGQVSTDAPESPVSDPLLRMMVLDTTRSAPSLFRGE
ncbi:uncharacterized protein SPSK_10171 [Sporothrix schenckii 1099-18]|uniref:Uncharacterized protein n=1 Tax=Sporothrix schenckii 1099-18 TaxID=1397361 RepID=A0A0F2M4M4_SPOSC|nr:uncharacterized protein SPSK_10171 [Sporothrix schenckii 1099-18]KJR84658.1 hypothetical protein SPSK_10171 [Sporothrix schenckii 1099-18]